MSWIVTGLTVGAVGGGLGGYFGTSKKNKDKRGSNALKFALLGAGAGAGLGAGGAALMGGGAASVAPGVTAANAASGGGSSALMSNVAGANSRALALGGMSSPSAMSLSSPAANLGTSGGFLKGLMYNDPKGNQLMQGGKSMLQSQLLQGVMGGGQESSPTGQMSSGGVEPGQAFQNVNANSIPIGMNAQMSMMSPQDKQKLLMSLMGG